MSNQDPSTAANPYAAGAIQDQNTLANAQLGQAAQGTLAMPSPQAMGTATLNYQYPSYPNAAGLGSQNPNSGFGVSAAPANGDSGQAFASTPITVNTPDTSSRGSNPWSFLGEANSRDTPPPISTPQQSPV